MRIKVKTLATFLPVGWEIFQDGFARVLDDGLKIMFSRDFCNNLDLWGPGIYRHMSFSRESRYPSWEEMKLEIHKANLFDRNQCVILILPPSHEYVNIHSNCFHWWQKE